MAFAFLSCEKDNELPSTELSGNWLLVEALYDPGDGSGTFETVDSDKTITFNVDGTYSATGTICQLNEDANQGSSGTYDTVDNLITPSDCIAVPAEAPTIPYPLEGDDLVLQSDWSEPW
jgi:hypothetical protein